MPIVRVTWDSVYKNGSYAQLDNVSNSQKTEQLEYPSADATLTTFGAGNLFNFNDATVTDTIPANATINKITCHVGAKRSSVADVRLELSNMTSPIVEIPEDIADDMMTDFAFEVSRHSSGIYMFSITVSFIRLDGTPSVSLGWVYLEVDYSVPENTAVVTFDEDHVVPGFTVITSAYTLKKANMTWASAFASVSALHPVVSHDFFFSSQAIESVLPEGSKLERITFYTYLTAVTGCSLVLEIGIVNSGIYNVLLNEEWRKGSFLLEPLSFDLPLVNNDFAVRVTTSRIESISSSLMLNALFLEIEYSNEDNGSGTITNVVLPQDKTWFLGKRSDTMIPSIDFPLVSPLAVEDVIKSGTIYPANDASATGIVFNDQELGTAGGLMVKGKVASNLLPVFPSADAITALKDIIFLDSTEVL
ncbi:MAG: hypothetical protein FWD45_05705 [Coriobacteriia bacterium]|nr:hypothetical protein [Coriobacteriia bacterium]